MSALVAYLVPPGVARCQQWEEAVLVASGHVSSRGCFALFLAPETGAPKDWLKLPPKDEMPSIKPARIEPCSWVGQCGNDIATFYCWEQEEKLDSAKVAARVLGALAWWRAR